LLGSSQLKLVLERYERRLHIYQEVVGILTLVQRDFKPEFSDFHKFRSATAEADFLFDPDIPPYLDEIVKRGMKLRQANREYRDLTQAAPPGYDHNKVVAEMHEQEVWFTEQFEVVKQKFKKYLYVSR
jgi:hypothetical protein